MSEEKTINEVQEQNLETEPIHCGRCGKKLFMQLGDGEGGSNVIACHFKFEIQGDTKTMTQMEIESQMNFGRHIFGKHFDEVKSKNGINICHECQIDVCLGV